MNIKFLINLYKIICIDCCLGGKGFVKILDCYNFICYRNKYILMLFFCV